MGDESLGGGGICLLARFTQNKFFQQHCSKHPQHVRALTKHLQRICRAFTKHFPSIHREFTKHLQSIYANIDGKQNVTSNHKNLPYCNVSAVEQHGKMPQATTHVCLTTNVCLTTSNNKRLPYYISCLGIASSSPPKP